MPQMQAGDAGEVFIEQNPMGLDGKQTNINGSRMETNKTTLRRKHEETRGVSGETGEVSSEHSPLWKLCMKEKGCSNQR